MNLDSETASLLGWDQIKRRLADLTHTPQGERLCLALEPGSDPATIEMAHARHRQLALLIDQGQGPPIEAVDEVEPDLVRAEKGGILPAEGVLRVARAMEVSSRVRGYLMSAGGRAGSALVDLARGSHDLLPAARDLDGAFEPDGRLRDSASPDLSGLRRQADGLADTIRTRLERMIRSGRIAAALGESYITQRSDRYVLPVRADSRGEIEGIVHDTSQSGATLFIEPTAVVENGNRLKIARAAVAEEERRILAEYSREIASKAGSLRDNVRMLARTDLVLASVRLAALLHGRLPELSGQGFDLLNARHPLMALEAEPVVANDIHLPEERLALVVTGPNAGGKTVVLKTLGLCCSMAQAGLPIPAAEGSRLGLFTSLAAVIGDAQDISRGLSTFSAHVERIGRILDAAGPGCLVLLDELAADTDPRHGAALAASILERLVQAGSTVLATTHYEELKQLPYKDDLFANASVGFDLESMEPTFSLHPDLPGRSLTLDIARRLGLPEEVLERAADRLDGSEHRLDRMLASLEDERRSITALRAELTEAKHRVERAADQHHQASTEFDQRRQDLLGQGREKLLAEIASVRGEVASVIESLRRGADMHKAVDSSHRLIEIEDRISEQVRQTDELARPAAGDGSPPDLRPGDRVRLTRLDKLGEVLSVDRAGSMVSVRLGPAHTRVPIEQVELVSRRKKRRVEARDARHHQRPCQPVEPVEVRSSANTIDLRGQRVDEATQNVDEFLDRLFGAGEPSAFIIHGHGTGALKAAVRAYLADSPYPRHFRAGTPEEGGDGVTVVALK